MQDEKVAMMQGEIDNLNQKVAYLESLLKQMQDNRVVPTQPWDVNDEISQQQITS